MTSFMMVTPARDRTPMNAKKDTDEKHEEKKSCDDITHE
jgi:hypothetical protein